jgi:hypothetical protein
MRNLFKIAILIVLVGCSDSSNEAGNDSNKLVTLAVGGNTLTLANKESLTVKNDTETIKISILSIEESRCPSDVECIWAGKVDVAFRFGQLRNIITLCLGYHGCEPETEVFYENENYLLKLLEVNPYPSSTNSNEPKSVTFELMRL